MPDTTESGGGLITRLAWFFAIAAASALAVALAA